MDEAPFSSNFRLYCRGLDVLHTVRTAGTAEEHVAAVGGFMDLLIAAGHSPHVGGLPGLEPGQERQQVIGYVFGHTKGGHKAIYCYGAHPKLVYGIHGGAIYEDKWPGLPFSVDESKPYVGEQKPTREFAQKNGFLIEQVFTIVVEKTGQQTENGRDIWRFVSAGSADLPAGSVSAGSSNGSSTPGQTATPSEAVSGGDEELCAKVLEHLRTGVKDYDGLVAAALRAFQKKPQLGACWDEIQRAIRRVLTEFTNSVQPTEIVALQACCRSITKVLPDGYAEQFCTELDQRLSQDTPF